MGQTLLPVTEYCCVNAQYFQWAASSHGKAQLVSADVVNVVLGH